MPQISMMKSKELVRIAQDAGFVEVRQTGSHKIMQHRDKNRTVPIPMHNKDVGRGLVRAIINQMGLTVEEFLKIKDR